MSERWDLYDEANRPTGEELRRGERMPKGRYHRVVEAWIRTPDGRITALTGGQAVEVPAGTEILMGERRATIVHADADSVR